MKVKCKFCLERVPEENMKAHVTAVGSSCRAALETVRLLGLGLRPLPKTHSLPAWTRRGMITIAYTRGAYEGEPRGRQKMRATPEEQHWVPQWVDIIVDLWSGPIYTEGDIRQAQRDACLHHVKVMWTSSMKQWILDARKEDLRAVRDLLKKYGAILGAPPMLLEEFEKAGKFQDERRRPK